jgi:hypothetical protein
MHCASGAGGRLLCKKHLFPGWNDSNDLDAETVYPMKTMKSRSVAATLSLFLAASLIDGHTADRNEKEQQPQRNQANPNRSNQRPVNQGQGNQNRPSPGVVNPGLATPNQGNPNRSYQDPGVRGQANPIQGRANPVQAEPNRGKITPDNATQGRAQGDLNHGNPSQGAQGQSRGNQIPGNQSRPGVSTQVGSKPDEGKRAGTAPASLPFRPQLTEVKKGNEIQRVAPSGKPREITKVDPKAGITETRRITPTGRVAVQEVAKRDGSRQIKELDLGNREKKVTVVHADKRTETTDVHYNRFGKERSRETVTTDARGAVVSRNVVVRQNLVIRNTTIVNVNRTVVRDYRPCRWGYVYYPVILAPTVFVGWYDPFWYGPRHHHFTYSWGWYNDPWYRYHAYYWEPYPVYAGPSYWVTDWMVAGYVADRYAVATSLEQTREEVRLAREEAEKARVAAEQARDAAEIAEAKAVQAQAEARAERAEARAAKAELAETKRKELGDKPNPNATPISKETKDALKDQVEKTIAEKKEFADKSAKGENPVPADVAEALKDPKHIYPVSKNLSVTRAEDSKPAGVLTSGDLLKVEPGQEKTLKDATENTPINMRVITSKGEDDSVPAGTVIAVPLKELQEFDNEFRAKIDLGLAEADKNKDTFKKNAGTK